MADAKLAGDSPLINALRMMTFQFDNDPDMSIQMQKSQYLGSVDQLAVRAGHFVFQDCGLTDAHMLVLCEILATTNVGQNLGLNISGKHNFNPEVVSGYITNMLNRNPNAVHSMNLPDSLSRDAGIKKIWEASVKGNSGRILSFDEPPAEKAKFKP